MKKHFRSHFIISASLILIALVLFSCKYGLNEFFYRDGVVNSRAKSLLSISADQIPSVPADSDYDFWIITDVHFGGENGEKTGSRRDDEFIQKINDLTQDKRPYFIVCLGDIAETGDSDEYKNYKAFTDKIALIKNPKGNPIVTYNIVGNHDLFNSGWDSYKKYCYPYTSFYCFKTNNMSWYFIDSGSGSLGKKQYAILKSAFASDSNPKMVFSHFPIYADGIFYFCMQDTQERNLLISLCAKNKVIRFFDGHTHQEITSDLGKFTENNLPGYLEKRGWAVVTVNETKGTASCAVKYLD